MIRDGEIRFQGIVHPIFIKSKISILLLLSHSLR